MRKRVHVILTSLVILLSSVALISCDAITAQKITVTGSGSFPGMNGGGRNGAQGMKGWQSGDGAGMGRGSGNSMRGMTNADLAGKVLSVDGNNVTVKIVELSQSKDNTNQTQGGFPGGNREWSETGEQKILTIPDSDSTIKASELKEGQIIMVWYKEGTDTVERTTVMDEVR